MSIEEWAEGLVKDAPHLFERNSGGGAAGSGAGSSSGAKNPWRKESWNLTEQMKLIRSDPKQAEQLKANAKQ
jgi:subtilase family serine protease